MTHYSYTLSTSRPAQIGLIALQSDETVEMDLHRMLPEGIELMVSRVPSGAEVTLDTLGAMEHALTGAAALFPAGARLSAVAYGCTSGTARIGAARVAEMIRAGIATESVTEPVTALLAACGALGIKRLGVLSPYVATVSQRLFEVVGEAGVQVTAFGSFDEAEEAKVVRISPESIVDAACDVAAKGGIDAMFLSCTNLRTLDVIEDIEDRIGKPVLSSNQVLAWHLFGHVGGQLADFSPGRIWSA